MSEQDQKYLDTLLLYYEEEVEGEVYFAEVAKAFEDKTVREKLELLGEVERHAALSVVPLLEKYNLTARPTKTLADMGRADAQATEVDWSKMLAGMNKTYPGYLDAFKELEAMAPPEDLPRLKFLTEHEVAAIEFLRLEAIDPANSTAPLKTYLETDPATWVPAAE